MDYDTLHFSLISTYLPQQELVASSNSFVSQYLEFLKKNEYERIVSFVRDEYIDIIVASLKHDNKFRSIRGRNQILNYFIQNYSHYVEKQLFQQFVVFSESISSVVKFESKIRLELLSRYFPLVSAASFANELVIDVAKSVFVIEFWEEIYLYIEEEVHENNIAVREKEYCEEEIVGLENCACQTLREDFEKEDDGLEEECSQAMHTYSKNDDSFEFNDIPSEWNAFLNDNECANYRTDGDDLRENNVTASVFDVLQSDFDW